MGYVFNSLTTIFAHSIIFCMGLVERLTEPGDKVEESKFYLPQTVGTARVKRVFSFKWWENDLLELDIPTRDPIIDNSVNIRAVPRGWFKKGDIAEVVAKRYRGSFLEIIQPEFGIFCRVMVRPFRPDAYGGGVHPESKIFNAMFAENPKRPRFNEGFYRRFLPEDFRKFKEKDERFQSYL